MRTIVAIEGDLTKQTNIACIVNAANTSLQMGGGVAGAIRRADPSGQIQAECDAHGPIQTGGAAITSGGDLPIPHVIHAAGPVWGSDTSEKCKAQLYDAYFNSLKLAHEQGIRTIAFPFISAGIFGFPIEEGAASIPLKATQDFLKQYPDSFDTIRFVGFGEVFDAFTAQLGSL